MVDEHTIVEQRNSPGWLLPAAVLGLVAGLAGIGVGWMASSHADQYQQSLENELKSAKADYTSQIATLQSHETQVDATDTQLQSDLDTVTRSSI